MNTSAKVLKKEAAPEIAEFIIPLAPFQKKGASDEATQAGYPDQENLSGEELAEAAESPEAILQQAMDEAAAIIAQAEREKEALAEAAKEKALEEIEAEIEKRTEERLAGARESFAETIKEIDGLREIIAEKMEEEAVQLAIEIARKIVGCEVSFDRDVVLTLVKVSLKKLTSSAPFAIVHLNPDDLAFLESRKGEIDFRGGLEFAADSSITLGGCLIQADTGDIDARIESRFDEIVYGLLKK